MRLKAPPHKHKPHSKKVKVNEPLTLHSSRVVCSAQNILFSSVYVIKSIIMRSFATWRVRIRIQSVKHVWMWQVSEHPANWNGANVLFHQLKQLYHVIVCVECYAKDLCCA